MFGDDKTVIKLDRYEVGAVLNSLIDERNDLIREKRPTDTIDEVILKVHHAKPGRDRERSSDEAR
jgi:hypothetical protein